MRLQDDANSLIRLFGRNTSQENPDDIFASAIEHLWNEETLTDGEQELLTSMS